MPNSNDIASPKLNVLNNHEQTPDEDGQFVSPINDRVTILLKDGVTTATIYPILSPDSIPLGLLQFLCDEYNMEIERGETLPFFDPFSLEEFVTYWFDQSFVAIMCLGDSLIDENDEQEELRHWENECLGTFYIKPNHPGKRTSHICTAEFLVNAGIRGKGIGRTLTDCFMDWAPKLGYTYTIFNMVFETNAAARKLWESMNFKRIGKIDDSVYVKNSEFPIDSIIYGKELADKNESSSSRFDNIKYYLTTGKYPKSADREERTKIRAGSKTYSLVDGKLMLKGKEVIGDPDQQMKICRDFHLKNGHLGMNKTTKQIAVYYHWPRVKDTVALMIQDCEVCKETGGEGGRSNKRQKTSKTQENDQGETRISDHVQAVISEVQESHLEGYKPTYAEVAASGLTNNSYIENYRSEEEDLDPDIVQPRVRTYKK
ncbi:SPT10 [Candida pseudojiufengensis]|uniref:SPT10 n=1 Tax=Candida pseudojiufengensis TaxID=497109 RepID=UPI0022255924|nr:SPT10 [Candida pseudojiufengensis]KAI5962333.1 SPT10 [Candida pseudojiufengensis]